MGMEFSPKPNVPDESQRVEDVEKAQQMAEAGKHLRDAAAQRRKYASGEEERDGYNIKALREKYGNLPYNELVRLRETEVANLNDQGAEHNEKNAAVRFENEKEAKKQHEINQIKEKLEQGYANGNNQ